jgi:hypothetical protein
VETADIGYDPCNVWGVRLRRIAVLFAVFASSQLGHALTYFARFGAHAPTYQSSGVHGYYPTLATGLGAVMGVVLLVSLAIVAAARCTLLAPAGYRPRATVRFIDVLAAAFAVQLMVFVGQETIEALAAGHAVPSVGELLLWGALGQLPAAAIAAAVIAWLLARLEAAWTAMVEGAPRVLVQSAPPLPECATRSRVDARLQLGSAFPSAFRKRGPPLPVQP